MGGATQPAGLIVLALSGSAQRAALLLPVHRLFHAYQAVAHSSHSGIEMHSLGLVGAVRAEEEGREYSRNQGHWSCSLPD